MANYGPVLLDFSPIANLGKTFKDAQDRARKRQYEDEAPGLIEAYLNATGGSAPTATNAPMSIGSLGGGSGASAQPKAPTFAAMQGSEPSVQLKDMFTDKERQYALPAGFLTQTAAIESRFDPNAQNPRSSAGGLFQFTDGTAKAYGLSNKFDPAASTDAAARLASDNRSHLANVLGRDPTPGELYLAHQQGAGGAAKLLANPNARAADVVGAKAVALNGGDENMTAAQFASKWTSKVDGGAADLPAPGSQNAQGFVIPGQGRAAGGLAPQSKAAIVAMVRNPETRAMGLQLWQSALKGQDVKTVDLGGSIGIMDNQGNILRQIPKEQNPTELQRNYKLAVDQGFGGSIVDYQTAIRKAGATTVNNNVGGTAIEPEFNKATGKAIGERFDAIAKEGDAARTDLAMVDQLRSVGGAINFNTMPALRGQLAEYGIKIGNDVGEIQAYNSIIDKLTPQQRVPGTGASSDLDVRMFKNSLPRLINTPDGNALIMDTMQAMGEDKIARAAIAERAQTGELTPAQAIKELRALPSPLAAFKERLKTLPQGADEPRRSPAPAPKPAPQKPAPVEGARQASDGNWYVPDPTRPGKYLQVQQ